MANGPPPPAPLDYAAIEARIDAALRQHVPEAFRVKKLDRARGWLLEKVAPAAGEWPNQDYGLWVTEDEQWIVATFGNHQVRSGYTPPLSNRTLFQRDDHMCMYCGLSFGARNLSRDHVTPVSQGGLDLWTNVVTACTRCNNHKAGQTPEQADMELLAVPFAPTHAEYIYLQGRNVLADQMAFLRAHFPRSSPLRERVQRSIRPS